MPPVVAPAPTVEWISSMKRIGIGRFDERGDHRLEALLEIAAEARAGQQRARVEREHLGALQQIGHVVVEQPRGEPSASAVLPTPASPTNTGLFFRRRQRISIVRCSSCGAADQRIELAGARARRQVHRVGAERILRRRAAALADAGVGFVRLVGADRRRTSTTAGPC